MDIVLASAVTALSAAILGAYMWSIRAHFVSESLPKGARVISLAVSLSAIVMLVLTWTVSQPAWAQVLGLSLQLASAALFASAVMASRQARLKFVFDPEGPQSLVQTGPYRFIRHPFYTSYVLFWSGWAIATYSALAALFLALLVALYVLAARREEHSFTTTPLAQAYRDYKARTGFFWPRLG